MREGGVEKTDVVEDKALGDTYKTRWSYYELKLGEKRQAYDVKYSCARAVSALILFVGSTCRHMSHTRMHFPRTKTYHSSRKRLRRYCTYNAYLTSRHLARRSKARSSRAHALSFGA